MALAFAHGVLPWVMAVTLACALLLRLRYSTAAQRLWLLIPGYGGLSLLAVAASFGTTRPAVPGLAHVPLVAGAVLVIGVGT